MRRVVAVILWGVVVVVGGAVVAAGGLTCLQGCARVVATVVPTGVVWPSCTPDPRVVDLQTAIAVLQTVVPQLRETAEVLQATCLAPEATRVAPSATQEWLLATPLFPTPETTPTRPPVLGLCQDCGAGAYLCPVGYVCWSCSSTMKRCVRSGSPLGDCNNCRIAGAELPRTGE